MKSISRRFTSQTIRKYRVESTARFYRTLLLFNGFNIEFAVLHDWFKTKAKEDNTNMFNTYNFFVCFIELKYL